MVVGGGGGDRHKGWRVYLVTESGVRLLIFYTDRSKNDIGKQ